MRHYCVSLLLLVVVLLGLCLPAAGRCEQVDGRLMPLLPPDTSQISGFDFAALRQTDLYRRWENALGDKSTENWGDLIGNTGIDPRTELNSIVLAGWAQGADRNADMPFVVFATGRFNRDRIVESVTGSGAEALESRGLNVYRFPEQRPEGSDDQLKIPVYAMTFIDDSTIVAGVVDQVMAVVERNAGVAAGLTEKPELVEHAQNVSALGQYWAVSESTPVPTALNVPDDVPGPQMQILKILSDMQESEIYLDVMNGFDLHLRGECDSPENAAALASAVRGFVSMGKLMLTPETGELGALFERINVLGSGNEIRLEIQLDSSDIDTLFRVFESTRPASAETL